VPWLDKQTNAPVSTRHFDRVVTDRVVEEPWVISKVRPGERVLDVGSATSRYLRELPQGCQVHAIDLRPTAPQPGIAVLRADLFHAPFRPATFDVVTCVSTIEHVGLDVYGQGPDEFGDEVATRHARRLLRPGGRLLLTVPFGRRATYAWHRVYDRVALRRLAGGYQLLSAEYYRRHRDRYVRCQPQDLADASFDFLSFRSDGVVLVELMPAGRLSFFLARLSLKLRRVWRQLSHRGPYWIDPWSGEPAQAWLRRESLASSGEPPPKRAAALLTRPHEGAATRSPRD